MLRQARSLSFVAALSLALHTLTWFPLAAQIPGTISYQGVLTDNGDQPLTGTFDMQFALFASANGGTQLWGESQSVNVENGVFNVMLGADTPISNTVTFNQPYWLQVTIEGSTLPRVELTSSAYSFNTSKIQGQPVAPATPAEGQVLKWDGEAWAPGMDNAGGTASGEAGGDLEGTYPSPTVAGIQGRNISNAAPDSGQVLKWSGTQWMPGMDENDTSISGDAGGDLGGTYPNPTVAKIQGRSLSSTEPSTGQVLKWTGDAWAPGADNTDGTASGTAGGDLSGSYPNPNVARVMGRPFSSITPSNGQVLKWSGSDWRPSADVEGNLTLPYSGNSTTTGHVFVVKRDATNYNYAAIYGESTTSGSFGIGIEGVSNSPSGYGGMGWNRSSTGPSIGLYGLTESSVGRGIAGFASNTSGFNIGVFGETRSAIGAGIQGIASSYSGNNYGVYGISYSTNGLGVYGYASNSSGSASGIYGRSNAASGYGVQGIAYAKSGINYGIYGTSYSDQGTGVMGLAQTTTGSTRGVYGNTRSTTGYGIYGIASNSTGLNYGVYGITNSPYGRGVYGSAPMSNTSAGVYGTGNTGIYGIGYSYGVYARATSGYAGYFYGSVVVTGALYKPGGSFEIDHPLDPENMILRHSFVESPDMMNVYNGNLTTDASGRAVVRLPDYFEALNRDFRYQLTVVGQFAQAIILEEIRNNQFAIQTDKPNVKVSWQVTGIRRDAWAEKNRIVVEEQKSSDERGYYLSPEAFDLPENRGINHALHEAMAVPAETEPPLPPEINIEMEDQQ